MDLARLDTVQLVPPTPMSPDGSQVLPERLGEFVKARVADGIRVFLPAAGTGEFHSLTAAEVVALVRATVEATREAAGTKCLVFAPIGFSVRHALDIAGPASDAGADGLLLMPPIHPYLGDSGFRDYFEAIAAGTRLPLLAYKKGPCPSDNLLTELGQGGRLVGIKYAVNEIDGFRKFADRNRSRLGLYCGTAERFAPYFMLAGATGYTSGAGNLFPKLTLEMHRALVEGRSADAMRLLDRIRPLEDFRARHGDAYNIAAVKAAMNLLGWNFGPVRPPQPRLPAADLAELEKIVRAITDRAEA